MAEPYTTKKYWDCECDINYIHSRAEEKCFNCGTRREDGPDSIVSEVEEYLAKNRSSN